MVLCHKRVPQLDSFAFSCFREEFTKLFFVDDSKECRKIIKESFR